MNNTGTKKGSIMK